MEIEAALKELPLPEAQKIAQWLHHHLDQQNHPGAKQATVRLPDYALRRRMIFGDKVLPNMILLGREQERW